MKITNRTLFDFVLLGCILIIPVAAYAFDMPGLREKDPEQQEREELLKTARSYERQELYDKAIELYREVLAQEDEQYPGKLGLEYRLATLYYKKGHQVHDYSKAIEVLLGITRGYDNTRLRVVQAHIKLAKLYKRLGKDDQAVKHYKTVVKLADQLESSPDDFDKLHIPQMQEAIKYSTRQIHRNKQAEDRFKTWCFTTADKVASETFDQILTAPHQVFASLPHPMPSSSAAPLVSCPPVSQTNSTCPTISKKSDSTVVPRASLSQTQEKIAISKKLTRNPLLWFPVIAVVLAACILRTKWQKSGPHIAS